MTSPLPSDRAEELAAGYALNNLSAEEAAEFEQMLATHPALAQSVTQLQEILDELPWGLPTVEPPQHLRSTVLAATSAPAAPAQARRHRLPWQILTACLAILVAALSVYNYRLRQALQVAQTKVSQQTEVLAVLQQPQSRLVPLTGVETSAAGSVVIDPNQKAVVVTLQGLATLPADQIYRLWAVIDNQKILCGEFNSNAQGVVLQRFSTTPEACSAAAAQLVVTREPVPAPPQPVGPAVLAAQLI